MGRESMNYLTRDDILKREDIFIEEVEVPEWGGTVRVRGMSGVERDAFENSFLVEAAPQNGQRRRKRQTAKKASLDNARAKLCAWCIVDGDGNRMFTDADVVALGAKSAAALDRVSEVAQELSGITEDDVEVLAQEMVEHPFGETC